VSVNWPTRKLANLCSIRTGKKDVNSGNPDGKYPFFTCSRNHTFSNEYSFDGEALLIAGNGEVGNISHYAGKFEAYQRTYVLMDFLDVLPQYLYYVVEGKLKSNLVGQKLGNTIPYIKKGMLADFEVPLPSIEEQKRIVVVLDQAFSALEHAHLQTENNLRDAEGLTELITTTLLNDASANNGRATTLGELCTIARGGSPRPIKRYLTDSADGVNWIKISDASASGQYIYGTKQKIHPDGISKSRFVKSGAFLLTNSMSFGRPYILKTDGCIHDGWLVLEPDYSLVDQSYLYYLLDSDQIYREFDRLAAGSTVRNLNINLVSNVRVSLPSLQLQQEVVRKIAAQRERYYKLLGDYQSRVEVIAELKQSLLHSAFAGNLV